MDWDENPSRGLGEWFLAKIDEASKLPAPHRFTKPQEFKAGDGSTLAVIQTLGEAVDALKRLGKPFLNWSGKAERLSFDVPTLPLFVHERLSTKAIIETLKTHRKDKGAEQMTMFDMFGDPQRSVVDQVLKPYEHGPWVNRMILGDSLVVMNSLLHYEGLGGQVQMVYIDPPYGVKFGSNFQPFVRKRDVSHNDDEDMTREPEMVKAYRDTWELGLHSYLTYMRDRLLLARDLLAPTGSVFVQISDENLHHVRELMDDIFGSNNFVACVVFTKTMGHVQTNTTPVVSDFIFHYAKDISRLKYRKLFNSKVLGEAGTVEFKNVELADGSIRRMTEEEYLNPKRLPKGARIFATTPIVSSGWSSQGSADIPVNIDGKGVVLKCGDKRHWSVGVSGTRKLWEIGRLLKQVGVRIFKSYLDDFPFSPVTNIWTDTRGETEMGYVVQTSRAVVQRCVLMSTDPGDLILDPTCGGGTTAYVAEQWGRRWITIDTSRVPLALARQRILTATFPYFQLKDDSNGPSGGFVFKRKKDENGFEIGGIVPHVTRESLANETPPIEEVLVDRPEVTANITRVSGPFVFEATIPTPMSVDGDESNSGTREDDGPFQERMLEVLRRSPVLHLGGGKTISLTNIRPPAKSLSLSAEAIVKNGKEKPVALVFGPENGAVSEKTVYEAAKEAQAKNYSHLYVIGFAVQPNARALIEKCDEAVGIPATYIAATVDLTMGDLLKNMRSSQIFSACGLPDIKLKKVIAGKGGESAQYQVELLGFDVLDPVTMKADHRKGDDVPAWFLDTNYNGLSFHVTQAFFPRTAAWDDLKKALRANYEETVWDHLAGTVSAPFVAGDQNQIAVKVIDDRGNELLVVKDLKEDTR